MQNSEGRMQKGGLRPGIRRSAVVLAISALLWGCERGPRVSTAGPGAPPPEAVLYRDTPEADLLEVLDRDFSPDRTLGYDRARDELYGREQLTVGALCTVYTEYCIALPAGDPSSEAFRLGINAEHVWPQSMGARAEPLRSDLHHVFPAREAVNSSRGNLPFGEVPDALTEAWYRDDESQSRIPDLAPDQWSERGQGRFEPREDRKGDIARAVFYVVATYPERAALSFFRTMQDDLLVWNRADPPDERERARSAWVASLQGTENPFVIDYTLADRIWNGSVTTSTPSASGPSPWIPTASGPLWINEIHYDNLGDDEGEGIEVAGSDGTSLDGWRLVLVNGSNGEIYSSTPLSGTLIGDGIGTEWLPVPGLQNGSPDGAALIAPDGSIAEAVSWEGAMSALGASFGDIGVMQPPDTPPGTSLQRIGTGREAADFRWAEGRSASPGWLNEGQRWR
ncbi:MAG: endonuclease [Bacteroidota bacterium]